MVRGDISYRKRLYKILKDMIYYAEEGDVNKVMTLNTQFDVYCTQAFSSPMTIEDNLYDNCRQSILFFINPKSMFYSSTLLEEAKKMFLKIK